MPRGASPGDLSIQVDPGEFSRFMRGVRAFDKSLATATRKRLREAAQPAVKDVKAHVREGGGSKTGMRAGIAAGTKVSIKTGRLAGITIVTSSAKMPAGKGPMVRAWNKPSFRHPVHGNTNVWVTQTGRPYFNAVLEQHRSDMERGMIRALSDAVEAINTGRTP